MDELVKRSDVLSAYYDDFYSHDYFPFEDVLNSVPAVDAVEVVRCKDCKQFMEYTKQYKRCVEGADGDCRIRLFHSCEKQFIACKYSDFCSYGERKGNG